VLDANVLISALLSRTGAPAALVERWLLGDFELVVSERLIEELEHTLARPKLRARIPTDGAAGFVSILRGRAEVRADPNAPPIRSRDPADDYLIALAEAARATLVSGDAHLLELRKTIPVVAPREFLDSL
jgi:uncharacterized protein